MRDGVILNELNSIEARVQNDIRALHDANVLCRTRIDAVENVLFKTKWSLIRAMFLSVFQPRHLQGLIDEEHRLAVNEYNEAMAKAAEFGKRHAKLTVVGGR